jgi:hypothetical protein
MLELKYISPSLDTNSSREVSSTDYVHSSFEVTSQQSNELHSTPLETATVPSEPDRDVANQSQHELGSVGYLVNKAEPAAENPLHIRVPSEEQNKAMRDRAESLVNQLSITHEAFLSALSGQSEPEWMPHEMSVNGSLVERTLMILHHPNNKGSLPQSRDEIARILLWNLTGEPTSPSSFDTPYSTPLVLDALELADLFLDYVSLREQLPEDLQRVGGETYPDWHQLTEQLERAYQIRVHESLFDRTPLTRPSVTFEEAVHQEAYRRSQQLEYWSKIHAEAGLSWNAKKMFVDRSMATGTLVSSDVVLIPDVYDPSTPGIMDEGIELFSRYQTPASSGERDYTSRFGFIFNPAHNSDSGMYTDTIYTLDARVVSALQLDSSGIGLSVLARIQAVATAANHDYVHNTLFPIYSDNSSPGLPSGAPIFLSGPIHDSILEWSLRFNGGFSQMVYVPLERHAYITHRQISEAIHRDYPEIKESLIDEGVQCMSELKYLRETGVINYEMSEYLADFHLRSTMTMVDARDPDLSGLKLSVDALLDRPKSIAPKTTLKFFLINGVVDTPFEIDSLSQRDARILLESCLKQPCKEDCLPEHKLAFEQLQSLLRDDQGKLKESISGFDAWQAKRNRRGESIDNIMCQSAVEFSSLNLKELREIERLEYDALSKGTRFIRPRGELVDTMRITQDYLRAFATAAAPTLCTTPEVIMSQHMLDAN